MSLALALVFVGIGVGLLTGGGELLVRGAVSLARLLRVSTAVIGLTIVAMGTSAPELAATLTAALRGSSDVAIGNVVGSNIMNVALIVGTAALVLPIVVHLSAVRIEWPIMVAFSVVGVLMARDGLISRGNGVALFVAMVAFTVWLVRASRREVEAVLAAGVDAHSVNPARYRALVDVALVVGGVLLLVTGAQLLVRGAVAIAEIAGITERVIGLTIVAGGTSLPELATSLVAARRGQADIALANVIGSNIFNLGAILGIVAIVTPQQVAPQIIAVDLWWMLGYALLLFPLMWSHMRINRLEGGMLLASYGVYLFVLLT